MEKIKIAVFVPSSVSLREGKVTSGRTTWSPSETELAALSDEARALLARYVDGPSNGSALELDTATVDAAAVGRAVEKILARDREAVATHNRLIDGLAGEIRAIPPEARVERDTRSTNRGVPCWCLPWRMSSGSSDLAEVRRKHPDVDAIIENAAAEVERRNRAAIEARAAEVRAMTDEALLQRNVGKSGLPHWDTSSLADDWKVELGASRYGALQAEARHRNDALEAAADARKAATKASLRAFAATLDDLARAAREGYEVETGVLDRLYARIVEPWQGAYDRWYDQWDGDASAVEVGDRSSPHADALAFRDAVLAHLRGLPWPEGLEVVELPGGKTVTPDPQRFAVQVSRVARVKYDTEEPDEDDEKTARLTGVAVWLTAPGYTPQLAVLRSPTDKG